MKPVRILLLLCLGIAAAAPPLLAQTASRVTLTPEAVQDGPLTLGGEGKLHSGDDPARADPAFDDSQRMLLRSGEQAQHLSFNERVEANATIGFVLGMLVTLAVLRLLLFLFFARPLANLFFALFALACASVAWLQYSLGAVQSIEHIPTQTVLLDLLLGPLASLTFGAFTYSLFYRRPPWHAGVYVVLVLVGPVLFVLASRQFYAQVFPWFMLLQMGMIVGIVGIALWHRKEGAALFGLGLLLAVASYVYHSILPGLGLVAPPRSPRSD